MYRLFSIPVYIHYLLCAFKKKCDSSIYFFFKSGSSYRPKSLGLYFYFKKQRSTEINSRRDNIHTVWNCKCQKFRVAWKSVLFSLYFSGCIFFSLRFIDCLFPVSSKFHCIQNSAGCNTGTVLWHHFKWSFLAWCCCL